MAPTDHQAGSSQQTALFKMIRGFEVSQALYAAAKLAVFDILADGPKTSSEIASAAGAHEPSLRRLLRFLTAVDILLEDNSGRFAATEMGELLRADHPQSVRAWALMFGAAFFWRPWGQLYETILTGLPAFNRVYGEPEFSFLSHNPDEATAFNAAMTSGTSGLLTDLLDACDLSGLTRIVDVGGGQGALLRGILERYPRAKGVLCEMPSVAAQARELRGSAVEKRCEFAGGDMFQSVPLGGDAYILKWIIHDWNDAEAIQILRNCRQAISDKGKIMLVERIIGPSNQPDPAKWSDLMMLVMLTGRERTEPEYRELYAAAGFKLTRVIPAGEFSIIEGIPV